MRASEFSKDPCPCFCVINVGAPDNFVPTPTSPFFFSFFTYTFHGDLTEVSRFKCRHALRNPKNIHFGVTAPHLNFCTSDSVYQLPTCWAPQGACWLLLAHPEKALDFPLPWFLIFLSSPLCASASLCNPKFWNTSHFITPTSGGTVGSSPTL